MKKAYYLFFIILSFTLWNCASSPFPALFYNSSEYHASGVMDSGPSDAKILKSGKSCGFNSIFTWLFYSNGEGNLEEAVKNGNITKVVLVDKSTFSILGIIIARNCVIVYGE
ncbi:TRL-like family protein [Leptospira inadai serovar Lyme str. 10]|uniref:TRL-like family protein n=2 Tax=Leptospira inadai serovar Lyme TaxID=293084 RepID=V6HLZ2_9LEPT|nr:TRL domain-containing protein [Leptospira inadai]EQA37900.1 TRL-like family protein [Leptospira inadai serovar Lyme str. 10]PNV75140.1 TRL-like family protein [Leptospira inadai serovar Lyme]